MSLTIPLPAGDMSAASVAALNIDDLGAQINEGLGVSVDDVAASEVFLLEMLIDDSGSISSGNNEQHVRDGVNLILDAMKGSNDAGNILVMIRYLNPSVNGSHVLTPYVLLDNTPRLTTANFRATGGTPLYDETAVLLATLREKIKEFTDSGVAVRSATLIITDGADGSWKVKAKDLVGPIADLLRTERHIVAGMGIDDGYTDFKTVFTNMGIKPEWILTPKNSGSEIRRACGTFSKASSAAAKSAAGFSQTAAGGFGTP